MLHFFQTEVQKWKKLVRKSDTELQSIGLITKGMNVILVKVKVTPEKVAKIIKYKLFLNLKIISLPIAYLSLLLNLDILRKMKRKIKLKEEISRGEESHETFGINSYEERLQFVCFIFYGNWLSRMAEYSMPKRILRNCQILIIVNSGLFKFLKITEYLSDNFKLWRTYSLWKSWV